MLKLLLLLTAIITQAWGKGSAQGISIDVRQAKLAAVFEAIEKQSSYHFIYTKEELQGSRPVSLRMQQASIHEVLDACLKDQPLEYSIRERYVIIRKKIAVASLRSADLNPANITLIIRGRVVNEEGEPVAGATIQLKGSMVITVSDEKGEWQLQTESNKVTLVISHISYGKKEIVVSSGGPIIVALEKLVSSLDESVVIAYGKTTQRLNTGNVSRVSAAEIARQPVSNPLAALQGRVPGLLITQSSGVPGSSFKVQIQGQQSIGAKGNTITVTNDPLIVIDGVPFAAGNTVLNQLLSAAGNPDNGAGLSPLNLINPTDIESIEVLKDADATAIYGSRGANGVLLITTKTGRAGKTRFSVSSSYGISKVTRTLPMLSTADYVRMRLEGIYNDGATPNTISFLTPGYAPDLLYWDTTQYTDWKKMFIGGTARTSDVQASVSGGSALTQFFLSGSYRKETTVFPGDMGDRRISARFNIQHTTENKKLTLILNGSYTDGLSNLNASDLTSAISLIPHLPGLTTADGKLKWEHNGVLYSDVGMGNPLSSLQNKYRSNNRHLAGNLVLRYRISPAITISNSAGYNITSADESKINPLAYANPALVTTGSASFGNRLIKSWITEPQAELTKKIWRGRLQVLAGASWQQNDMQSQSITANGYTNDNLLYTISGAGTLRGSNSFARYKYNGVFGRINYVLQNEYILNLSGRRDGSSRFGSGRQFANFGAAGFAWIFSRHKGFDSLFQFISYGKLRISYGTTGNDQIGDYKFLSTWTTNSNSYQQIPTLNPSRLANPDYSWEINHKFQAGLELGFFKDRVLFNCTWFKNRSDNQLVSYPLAIQSGFSSLGAKNIPALVDNTGIEFSAEAKLINGTNFSWKLLANITSSRNKLVRYPDLALSSYANTYVTGQSLNVIYRYEFLGVDPQTGIYQFRDVNGDGIFNTADYVVNGNTDPKYFGGVSNEFNYKHFSISFYAEFRKQTGADFRRDMSNSPGSIINQPVSVLKRWQQPGDITAIQKFSAYYDSPASLILTRFMSSSGAFSDASYIRLRNLALNYHLKPGNRLPVQQINLFIQAQNLFTLTSYEGADPDVQSIYRLPPLRTISFGISLNF